MVFSSLLLCTEDVPMEGEAPTASIVTTLQEGLQRRYFAVQKKDIFEPRSNEECEVTPLNLYFAGLYNTIETPICFKIAAQSGLLASRKPSTAVKWFFPGCAKYSPSSPFAFHAARKSCD